MYVSSEGGRGGCLDKVERPTDMKLTAIKGILPACGVIAVAVVLPLSALHAAESKTEKLKPYPLKTCVVSGEKLDGMGKPHVLAYQGREIKLCCAGCLKEFNKEPAKYIKKLEAAEKQAEKQPSAAQKR